MTRCIFKKASTSWNILYIYNAALIKRIWNTHFLVSMSMKLDFFKILTSINIHVHQILHTKKVYKTKRHVIKHQLLKIYCNRKNRRNEKRKQLTCNSRSLHFFTREQKITQRPRSERKLRVVPRFVPKKTTFILKKMFWYISCSSGRSTGIWFKVLITSKTPSCFLVLIVQMSITARTSCR